MKSPKLSLRSSLLPLFIAAVSAYPAACLAVYSDPLHALGPNATIEQIVGRFVAVILGLLGSVSLIMFVYGGITYMTAQGNEEKIKKAKNTLVYAILGLVVAFGAFEILKLFFNDVLFTALKRT